MISILIVFHILVSFIKCTQSSALSKTNAEEDSRFVIAGYWPNYRAYVDITESASVLTDIILFSIQPDENGLVNKDLCCLGRDILEKSRAAQAVHESLNVLISVGGAGRSAAFAKISGDEERRSTFLHELKMFCLKETLNGVDFDWEQPSNRDEYSAYLHLLTEASSIFHREGLMITLALHPGQILPRHVYEHIDKIHLMTYDMLDQAETHHASFTKSLKAIELLINSGCDPAKIVVGLPAYSRNIRDPSQVKTYSEVLDLFFKQTSYSQNEDHDLAKLNAFGGFTLESQVLVRRKVQQAVVKKLAGVFIWEIGQDYRSEAYPSGLLLHNIYEAYRIATDKKIDELF